MLTLARATADEIARRTGLAVEVITLWQQLYFDVGLDAFRQATMWHFHVVARMQQTNPMLAARMRHALAGGLERLDQILAAETGAPSDEAGQLDQRQLRLLLRAEVALDQLSGVRANYLALVKLYGNMLVSQQRLQIEREARQVIPPRPLPTAALLSKYFRENEKVSEALSLDFLIVKVNYSEENQNKEFLGQYPGIRGYPHLFVLDSEGKLLHSQNTADLEEGKGYQEERMLAFFSCGSPGRSFRMDCSECA